MSISKKHRFSSALAQQVNSFLRPADAAWVMEEAWVKIPLRLQCL